MEIFFHDPSDVPLPPEEVHIRTLKAKPYPDGRRVRVYLELSPFQKRPSGALSILNPLGEQVASVSIIETIDPRMEMTLHIRGPHTPGTHTIQAEVFYETLPEEEQMAEMTTSALPRMQVDAATETFEL